MKDETEQPITDIYTKLAQARKILRNQKLTKSGRNDFAGYNYFELGDFLPHSLDALDEVGLAPTPVSFTADLATLRIVDPKTKEEILTTSPMSTAQLKGCHPVQNLGAVQTYLRRYLWSAVMELIEGDPLDGSKPLENGASAKLPANPPKTPPRGVQRQESASGASVTWQGMIDHDPKQTNKYEGTSKSGKPYTLFRVTLDDGRTATTFDEELYTRVQNWDVLQEVMLRVTPNLRSSKPDTWELLDLQKVEEQEEWN